MLRCGLVQVNVTDILQGYIIDDCANVSDTYCQISNISHSLVGNKIVDHSDVVGASPVGAAPTTSSFST